MLIGGPGASYSQVVRLSDRLVPVVEGRVEPKPQQTSVTAASLQEPVARSSYVHVQTKPAQFFAISSVAEAEASGSRKVDKDVEDAHRTALSALNNERFRHALELLSDVGTSDAVVMLQRAEGSGTDFRSARAIYAENNE
ncbi:hypothetical protein [Aminobacter sp. AP02]|uniref:hypothetical protein n=1 Tax=Aminobacter sp. AP02 TaxID=2135737 RepID=UPI000D6CDD15|nr:hypothetical protein [Aminobacter sp. AP02]PWK69079.1 hypothetical protein C8K44_109109 [Aminobacter sp. AP02]